MLLLLGACGGSTQVKDDQVAKLPTEDRRSLMDEEQAVRTAEANLDTSRVAIEEAKKYRSIVDTELDGAKAQHEAAKQAIELTGEAADQQPESAARERAQVEREHLSAFEAKAGYADSLVELRRTQEGMRKAELDLARAQLEREELNTLRARGMGKDLKEDEFAKHEREAQNKFEEARFQVEQVEGQTRHARETWDEARQQYEASARRTGVTDVPIGAPPPREALPTPAAKEMPAKQHEHEQHEHEQHEEPSE